MFDLNSILFYKAKFTISSLKEDDDLLWRVVLHIRDWQKGKARRNGYWLDSSIQTWSKLKTGWRIIPKDDNKTVYIEAEYFAPTETEEFWACKIVEKKPPTQGICLRQWITEIGFERTRNKEAVFSCVITYNDIPGFIGPCEEQPGPTLPGFIPTLLADEFIECFVGEDRVTARAQRLTTGDFPQFWNRVESSGREMPYVYISPMKEDFDSCKTILPLDPQALAKAVCANALVFYSDSLDFSFEMNYMLKNENYTCHSGRIRVYMPQLNTKESSDAYKHRYITPAYISEVGTDNVIQIFRRALAQNVNFYESFFRVGNCRDMIAEATRQKRLSDMRSRHEREKTLLANQKFEEEFENVYKLEEEKLIAESNVQLLQDELSEQKTENYRLETQVETMRSAANRCSDLEKALSDRYLIKEHPSNKNDIVSFFGIIFRDKIAFSDDALKSLKTCKLPLSDLWDCLYNLATEMQRLFYNGGPDPYKEFKEITGMEAARSEGSMTRKDKVLMKQFKTEYDSRIIDIEPHITYASRGQSIHFGYDSISQKIVIGHCGEHLEIYSSRKVK